MNLLNYLYPKVCRHCESQSEGLLCEDCLELLTLFPVKGRCDKCFSEIAKLSGTCKPCRKRSNSFKQLAACFDILGPASSLLSALERGGSSKEIASFMVLQLNRLSWPLPDSIIPLPSFSKRTSHLIADQLAKLLDRPLVPILQRRWCVEPEYYVKKKWNITGQCVLLVDHSMGNRKPMLKGAERLEDECPNIIYGLTFCF